MKTILVDNHGVIDCLYQVTYKSSYCTAKLPLCQPLYLKCAPAPTEANHTQKFRTNRPFYKVKGALFYGSSCFLQVKERRWSWASSLPTGISEFKIHYFMAKHDSLPGNLGVRFVAVSLVQAQKRARDRYTDSVLTFKFPFHIHSTILGRLITYIIKWPQERIKTDRSRNSLWEIFWQPCWETFLAWMEDMRRSYRLPKL